VNREGKTDEALHFEEANQRTSGTPSDKNTKALTNLLSGAAVYKADKNRANDLLAKPEVQGTVSRNPHVLGFASKEMDVKNLNSAVAKAAARVCRPSLISWRRWVIWANATCGRTLSGRPCSSIAKSRSIGTFAVSFSSLPPESAVVKIASPTLLTTRVFPERNTKRRPRRG
jgi:hypothetical protein